MGSDKHAGHAGKAAGSKELWKSFVDAHADLEMLESGKVKCRVTGHEMVATKEVVEVRHDDLSCHCNLLPSSLPSSSASQPLPLLSFHEAFPFPSRAGS